MNQIILAGLKLALRLVSDESLKVNISRICCLLSVSAISINRNSLRKAKNSLDRLSERYLAALEIINILYESQGIVLEDDSKTLNLYGYFFDMNTFFENLVCRLLTDYAKEYDVKDQYNLHDLFVYAPQYNPKARSSPTPRPDFALMQNGKVVKLLDAKYRDLWKRSLPRDMLYQLAVYAVSGVGNKTATILYPALSDIPTLQKV